MRKLLLLLMFFTVSSSLHAQYFNTGSSDVTTRWSQLKSDDKQLIYPDFFGKKASTIENYVEFATPYITTGLLPKIDKVPIVIYPEKAKANGLVTWTPKRMELYTTPSIGGYSEPWLKQLAVHEYRHVVQLSNLNRGLVKSLGYVIGEHAVGAAAAILPKWFYEGDATLAETQLAIWGRGKQPEFSLPVRALLGDAPSLWSYERWRVGSMRYEYPSVYELGYFSVWAGQTFYSPDIWSEMMAYCGDNPIFAIFNSYNIKRKYGANREVVANRAVEELKSFWSDSWSMDNSSQFLPNSYPWYEKFKNPILLNDTTLLVERMNKSSVNSFVATNINSGDSELLDNSAYINSRAELVGDRLYWSEYKPSFFWENRSYSVVKTAKIVKKKRGAGYKFSDRGEVYTNGDKSVYFVTSLDEKGFAYINFDKENNPEIVITDGKFVERRRDLLKGWDLSVIGMDYDSVSDKLYLSIVDNSGVNLISYDIYNKNIERIRKPSHVTITNLRADNGELYFTSTASGKDEVHLLELESGREFQLTNSKYGSFGSTTPFVDRDGERKIATTTYKFTGYALSTQKLEKSDKNEIVSGYLPDDKLVPDWYDWGVPKIDSVDIPPLTVEELSSREKRYRKFGNSFAPHSWIPLALDIDQIVNERVFDIGIGATVMSQNLLGGVVSSIGYGYVPRTKLGIGMASLDITTLPVHFGFNAQYGGEYQTIYVMTNSESSDNDDFDMENDSDSDNYPNSSSQNIYSADLKKYSNLSLTASLPMSLSDGRRSRYFSPYISYSYQNSLIVEDDGNIIDGMDKLSMGVEFQNYKYMSERDLNSPLGYTVSVSGSIDPTSNRFGELYSLYGRGVVPGLMQNHSLEMKANLQYQKYSDYNFLQKSLYPSGCNNNIAFHHLYATTATYEFPLIFPDWGIKDLIFFRRISMGAFIEYAHGDYIVNNKQCVVNPYTYGGEIMFDYNLIGTGSQFYTGISIYKPSECKGVMVGFSFNFAL